jgi:hypothetical protein
MAGWTDATEAAILNCYLNQTNITAPTAIYLGIFSADPNDAGAGGTELTGNGYARVEVTNAFPAATTGNVSNNVVIDFPAATGAWSAGTSLGLFTASSGGTPIRVWAKALSALSAGQFHRIASGALTFDDD